MYYTVLFFFFLFFSRELQDKSEQLLRVKKEKAAVLSDLEAKLAAREQEVGDCILEPKKTVVRVTLLLKHF